MASDNKQEVLDGLMRDLKRAAELGLLPREGASISVRGEFIVNPSNIEDAENAKMRRYRHKEYPKHLHGWGVNEQNPEAGDGPLFVEVRNAAEEEAAIAAGWSPDPVHGPKGRLTGNEAAEANEVDEVADDDKAPRVFAAPGAFSGTPAQTAAEPKSEVKAPKAAKADKLAAEKKAKAPKAAKANDASQG